MAKGQQPLTESEIGSLVAAEIARAIDYDHSTYRKDRVRAQEYFFGDIKDLPAEEGRSSITSRDVSDIISAMLPGLLRVFFSGDEIVVYNPQNPEDEEYAKQATEYVNYLLREADGYTVFTDVFHNALLHANGVVKVIWEPYEHTTTHVYHNLDETALSMLLQDDEVEVVESEAIQTLVVNEMGVSTPETRYNLKIKRTQKLGRVKIVAIPPEEFLINPNATSIRDSVFCGHRSLVTRSSLIEQKYDPELVAKLSAFGGSMAFDRLKIARDQQFGSLYTNAGFDESMDIVEVVECYIKADYDGDGIAETLKVIMGGEGSSIVLDWEEWEEDAPFADFIMERVPHRWVGRSMFDHIEHRMKVKTVLERQLLDNLYASNIPDRVVNETMIENMDAVYDRQLGNVIRVNGDPNAAIAHVAVPFVAQQALQGIAYIDESIEKSSGVSQSTMALDMNALQNQTATAINAAQSAAYSKVELVARNFAEMGFKRFFKLLLKLIIQNQDKPRTVRLRNKWVEFDPTVWNASMDCTISVGLGSGSKERDVAMLQGIASKQEQIIQLAGPNNPIVSIAQYANTLKKMVEAGGIKNSDQFFNDVTPEAMAQAPQGGQQPDPKQQEAMAKQQEAAAKLQVHQQEAAARIQLAQQEAAAKIQLQQDQAAADMQLQRERNAMELQASREKYALDLQHKREIAALNAQLKHKEMQDELALSEQSNLLNAYAKTGHRPDTNIAGQQLSGE
jgi:hypothetical protein